MKRTKWFFIMLLWWVAVVCFAFYWVVCMYKDVGLIY